MGGVILIIDKHNIYAYLAKRNRWQAQFSISRQRSIFFALFSGKEFVSEGNKIAIWRGVLGWKVKESTNVTKDQIILSAWRSKKTHCFAIITTYQYIFALLWVCTLKSTMFKFHHSFHFKRSLSTCYKLKKYISWPLCQSLLKGGSNIQKFHFEKCVPTICIIEQFTYIFLFAYTTPDIIFSSRRLLTCA